MLQTIVSVVLDKVANSYDGRKLRAEIFYKQFFCVL
jgi:hypothetical protein